MTRRILFVCVGNSCRSQMAEGFARHYAQARGLDLDVQSAGTMPAGTVSRNAIAVMAERGIDISSHTPKALDLAYAEEAHDVLTMGCSAEEACPAHIVKRMVDWGLDDPVGQDIEVFRTVRDEIDRRVRALLDGDDAAQ